MKGTFRASRSKKEEYFLGVEEAHSPWSHLSLSS